MIDYVALLSYCAIFKPSAYITKCTINSFYQTYEITILNWNYYMFLTSCQCNHFKHFV